MNEIGARVRALRVHLGWGQAELAERVRQYQVPVASAGGSA